MIKREIVALVTRDILAGHVSTFKSQADNDAYLACRTAAQHGKDVVAIETLARTYFNLQTVKLAGPSTAPIVKPAPAPSADPAPRADTPLRVTTASLDTMRAMTLDDLVPMRAEVASLLARIDDAINYRKARSASASQSRARAHAAVTPVTPAKDTHVSKAGNVHTLVKALVCDTCGMCYTGAHTCRQSAPLSNIAKLALKYAGKNPVRTSDGRIKLVYSDKLQAEYNRLSASDKARFKAIASVTRAQIEAVVD